MARLEAERDLQRFAALNVLRERERERDRKREPEPDLGVQNEPEIESEVGAAERPGVRALLAS